MNIQFCPFALISVFQPPENNESLTRSPTNNTNTKAVMWFIWPCNDTVSGTKTETSSVDGPTRSSGSSREEEEDANHSDEVWVSRLFQHKYLMTEGIINVSDHILFFFYALLAMNLLLKELHKHELCNYSLSFLRKSSLYTSVTIYLI